MLRRMLGLVLTLTIVLLGAAAAHSQDVEEPHGVQVQISDSTASEFRIPEQKQIKRVEAEIYNAPNFLAQLPNIGRFIVPEGHYDRVIMYFQHPVVDHLPRTGWPEVGCITIVPLEGDVVRIPFYWTKGKGGLNYSIKGVRFRNGSPTYNVDEGMTLDLFIRVAYRDATGLVATEPIPEVQAKCD